MISRQFLITGMIWALLGGLMSVLFRLQLGYPDTTFPLLEEILGKWAKGGHLSADAYYALITIHGTVLIFFVLTRGASMYLSAGSGEDTMLCANYVIFFTQTGHKFEK